MNANPKFLAATAHVDDAAVQPLPNSRKIYVGPLRVPMCCHQPRTIISISSKVGPS